MFRSFHRVYRFSGTDILGHNVIVPHVPRVCKRDKRCYSHIKKMTSENENIKNDLFKGTQDRYNGITIESKCERCSPNLFPKKLEDSLQRWVDTGKRGIWFKVDLNDSDWVPVLAKNGFNFHHACEGFVMMYKWLPEKTEICNIPPFAHTNLGVGAIVINDSNQVLAVSEKYFQVPHWKLPGGYVEKGEDIVDAAMREVKEETGIDTEFHSVISFRHAHNMMFGNSDIYMIVRLLPLSHTIERCERELVGCQWMDLEEFLKHPHVHELNRMLVRKALEHEKRGINISAKKDVFKLLTMQKEFTIFSLKDA